MRARKARSCLSAPAFGYAEFLFLSFLTRGVTGVALELLLEFKTIRLFATRCFGLSTADFSETYLFEPSDFLVSLTCGLGGFCFYFAFRSLNVANFTSFQNRAALGLSLLNGGIIGIVFRTSQELFRHILAGLGCSGLAVLEGIRV